MDKSHFPAVACLPLALAVMIGLERGTSAPPKAAAATIRADTESLALLARQIRPSVVQVATRQRALPTQQSGVEGDLGDPRDGLWQRYFGIAPSEGQIDGQPRSLGSGFIIDPNGTILTNHHVLENSDRITVRLDDESEFVARLVGQDQKTDLAIIKIDADRDLPAIRFGDSDALQVGEWVVAVGSPLGLNNSFSVGIVSATGRAFSARPYNKNSFIQTDASINPGSSGGPLINLKGEVVGINTAIYSRTGANIGIGFAISINLVKDLLPQLRDTGRVARGWLGVAAQPLTPELAAFLGMSRSGGALVSGIQQDSPAAHAGVRAGDVIVGFEGAVIEAPQQLAMLVAQTPAGCHVTAKILRDGKEVNMNMVVALSNDEAVLAPPPSQTQTLGVTVDLVTPQIARRTGLGKAQGVIVSTIDASGTAADAGLRVGDLILEIDRRPIRNVLEFDRLINREPKTMLFLIRRGEDNHFVAFAPHPRPGSLVKTRATLRASM